MKKELIKLVYEKLQHHKNNNIIDYKLQFECFCKEILEILGEL